MFEMCCNSQHEQSKGENRPARNSEENTQLCSVHVRKKLGNAFTRKPSVNRVGGGMLKAFPPDQEDTSDAVIGSAVQTFTEKVLELLGV